MKTTKTHILFALLLMAGGVKLQAQEQRDSDGPTGLFECQAAQNTTPIKQPAVVAVEDAWLHYGSDVYGSNLAYVPEGVPFSWAVSFPPSVLQSYDGFTLTRVALYENEWIMDNLNLGVYYGNEYMPLTLKNEQNFAPTGYVGLCDIALDQPVEIDVTQHLWVVFSELDMTETFSAAFCYDDNPDPYARWVQMEENKWDDVANYGPWESLQFMIWAYVTNDPWGVEETIGRATMDVYPNPANDVLFVETRRATSLPDQTYRIINLMGQTLMSGQITTETQQIDVSDLPDGLYFITFAGETRKFVVH